MRHGGTIVGGTIVVNVRAEGPSPPTPADTAPPPYSTLHPPADTVTPYFWMRLYTLSPSRRGPGRTMRAPTMGAENTMPQQLAWNMGTMGSAEEAEPMGTASGCTLVTECRNWERWEYSTPLGLPVVPLQEGGGGGGGGGAQDVGHREWGVGCEAGTVGRGMGVCGLSAAEWGGGLWLLHTHTLPHPAPPLPHAPGVAQATGRVLMHVRPHAAASLEDGSQLGGLVGAKVGAAAAAAAAGVSIRKSIEDAVGWAAGRQLGVCVCVEGGG